MRLFRQGAAVYSFKVDILHILGKSKAVEVFVLRGGMFLPQRLEGTRTEITRMAPEFLMCVGEALVGEGNEVAHIDLLIGDKAGPVGLAFANALSTQSQGHSNLLAVLTPNLAVKPATVMITKVTIKGQKQAVQMFGPAQYAVAKAVADSVEAGVIPKDQCETS
jgi:hypothetical protein